MPDGIHPTTRRATDLAVGVVHDLKVPTRSKSGGWFDHRAENGWSVSQEEADKVARLRSNVPQEPHLQWTSSMNHGWYYRTSKGDPSDFTARIIADYLAQKGYEAGTLEHRTVRAFGIFSELESGLSSVQSYDAVGATFGCGYALGYTWGAEGQFVAARMCRTGELAWRLRGHGLWFEEIDSASVRISVVDTENRQVVCGKLATKEGNAAVDLLRGHTQGGSEPERVKAALLDLVIDCARDPDTRLLYADAVFGRLVNLLADGDPAGVSKMWRKIHSDALFGFLAHVNHWGSGKAGKKRGGIVHLANEKFEVERGDLPVGPARDEEFAVYFHDLCVSSWYQDVTGVAPRGSNFEDQCNVLVRVARSEGLSIPL